MINKYVAQEREYLLYTELPALITRIICLSGGKYIDKQILDIFANEIRSIVDLQLKKEIELQLLLYCGSDETSYNG